MNLQCKCGMLYVDSAGLGVQHLRNSAKHRYNGLETRCEGSASGIVGGGNTVAESSDILLAIHCPTDVYEILRAAGFDKETLAREARESLALRLYAEHRLSLGKSAELAGLPIVKFMDLLRALHMPLIEYGEDEYRQDLHTIAILTLPPKEPS